MIRVKLGDSHTLLIPLNPLTYDELHAVILGSMGYWFGQHHLPLPAAALCLHAIHSAGSGTKGATTIRDEPWYFVGAMVISYQIGRFT